MKKDKGKILILVSSIGLGILISTMMKSNLESYAPRLIVFRGYARRFKIYK